MTTQLAEKIDLTAKPAISVLLIDDDRSEYDLVQPMLASSKVFDYDITYVSTYKEGLQELQSNAYSVCLLDYNLGMETGLDLMKDAHKAGTTTPVILVTGATDENVDYLGMQEGAEDYLRKDEITPQILERTVRYAILRNKMQRDLMAVKEDKNQFVSFITRELTAPLHNIMGTAERALAEGDYLYNVEDIRQTSEYVLEQINDLLDLTRIDKVTENKLHETVFELPAVIDKAVFFMKQFAERQKIKLKTEVDPKLPEIKADMRMVRQMMINLIYHAIKCSIGAEEITVKAYMDGINLVLEVKDNGSGMPVEDVKALMNTPKLKGPSVVHKGLGVPLAKHYIDMHDGTLEIKNERSKSTRAILTFPSERVLRFKNSILNAELELIKHTSA